MKTNILISVFFCIVCSLALAQNQQLIDTTHSNCYEFFHLSPTGFQLITVNALLQANRCENCNSPSYNINDKEIIGDIVRTEIKRNGFLPKIDTRVIVKLYMNEKGKVLEVKPVYTTDTVISNNLMDVLLNQIQYNWTPATINSHEPICAYLTKEFMIKRKRILFLF